MMVLQLVWVHFMVPETKGIPLEEMQKTLGIADDDGAGAGAETAAEVGGRRDG
jgi:hypothetical protein